MIDINVNRKIKKLHKAEYVKKRKGKIKTFYADLKKPWTNVRSTLSVLIIIIND